ncbi:MAG: aldolase/citrate lyase family protein [Sedimentibacter sp.]|uniref:HpcH/HpaI aldolase family protein n=1 Tax=Sedimentibacter sp. TaxID=1960295 RepID=UPI0031586420
MINSRLKKQLLEGKVMIGAFFKANNPNMVEMMAYAGYDFIIVDNEHSNFDHIDTENIIRAADGVNLDTIIRIPSASEENILHSLDSGASGIQVPSLRNADDAKKFVPFTKYYPVGNRGMNVNQRAAKFGFMPSAEYFKSANENTLVVVHVENVEMAEQIDELCKIPEIDVIFIGAGDLSQSVGKPMQVNDPEVIKVVDNIIDKTKKSGKIVGAWVGNIDDARKYIEKGARYLGFLSDSSIFINALKDVGNQIESLKQVIK